MLVTHVRLWARTPTLSILETTDTTILQGFFLSLYTQLNNWNRNKLSFGKLEQSFLLLFQVAKKVCYMTCYLTLHVLRCNHYPCTRSHVDAYTIYCAAPAHTARTWRSNTANPHQKTALKRNYFSKTFKTTRLINNKTNLRVAIKCWTSSLNIKLRFRDTFPFHNTLRA